jgi:hypothetical protein
MVARLLYLAKRVRPDILLPVIFLATRVKEATEEDQEKLTRVIKYLSGSRKQEINFDFNNYKEIITCYVDAAYAVHSDRRSHSGQIILYGGGPVLVASKKQKSVTKSSWEAEIMAVSEFGTQAIWIKGLIQELGYKDKVKLLQDNMGAVASLTRGSTASPSSRHVDIKHLWIHERIRDKDLTVEWTPTELMLADGFTKPLQGAKFRAFNQALHNDK